MAALSMLFSQPKKDSKPKPIEEAKQADLTVRNLAGEEVEGGGIKRGYQSTISPIAQTLFGTGGK